ncbi:MAG: ribbon-helix-helix domain-containing protein [Candidatus Saccharimonadales bacterium]
MSVKTFNVSFPKELADQIDKKAKEQFGSRSDLLRTAAMQYLEKQDAIDQLKELMTYGKRFAENAPFKSDEEVAEYITDERRKKEPWRQNIARFKDTHR